MFCVLLVGCKAVDELDSWDGMTRSWVTAKLGNPDSQDMMNPDVPDFGTGQTVASKIQKTSPGYQGQVEHLQWRQKRYNYDVYLILIEKDWVIVDAVKWQKDVQF